MRILRIFRDKHFVTRLVCRADLQIDDPRKIWVKKRNTGDMIEVQLDKEKPERYENFNHYY